MDESFSKTRNNKVTDVFFLWFFSGLKRKGENYLFFVYLPYNPKGAEMWFGNTVLVKLIYVENDIGRKV